MGWEIWLIIALACVVIECFTVDFSFLMIAGGALAGALMTLVTPALWLQVVVFGVISVLLLGLVRPWVKEHFNVGQSATGSVQAQIGRQARTLTTVDEESGRVSIGGDVWSARSASGTIIPEGSTVVVADIDGVVAVVR